jgi:lipopolysaccharide/colanic/teichoic acid biosynthesis glycosyltransferase
MDANASLRGDRPSLPGHPPRPPSDPLDTIYARHGKRVFDLLAGGAGTVAVSPLLAVLAAVVYVDSGRPIFFRQERVGLNGRVFRIFKFRTMVPDAVEQGRGYYLEEGDPRITRCGSWMRATSLDELPQFLNVVLGDMSLVGPRPNLTFIVERYRPHYDRILRVRPGITSLVGIGGRNRLKRSQMLALDDEYVTTLSFRNDLRILLKTVPAVLFRHGATDDVSEEFMEDVTLVDGGSEPVCGGSEPATGRPDQAASPAPPAATSTDAAPAEAGPLAPAGPAAATPEQAGP